MGGGSLRNIAIPFGMEKLEWCGYQMVKKLDIFIRFDMIHERDRQQTHSETDRQAYRETGTAWRDRPRLCIASRGKYCKIVLW